MASPAQDMLVISVTCVGAYLYITLQSLVRMSAQRITLSYKPDLRKVASDPRLNLLGSSAMRLEDLIATYSCHRVCEKV